MCSGVLYHMEDPIALISSISRVTSNCFVWTHYYDQMNYPGPMRETRSDPRYPGVPLYTLPNKDMGCGQFWGGNRSVAVWLSREDLLQSFIKAGLTSIDIIDERPHHPNGAALTFAASRR
jgi:hypothetical protein